MLNDLVTMINSEINLRIPLLHLSPLQCCTGLLQPWTLALDACLDHGSTGENVGLLALY